MPDWNDCDQAISYLETWYQNKCDGHWEHRYGVTIESCDNPGWLVTIDSISIGEKQFADLQKEVSQVTGVQMIQEEMSLRLFSISLKNVLVAVGIVVRYSKKL